MKLNEKQFNYLAGGVIALVSLLVYINTFNVPLQFDDIYHVQHKQLIQDIDKFAKINAWSNVGTRPFAMFTMALNYRWGGDEVTGYHVMNLIFHIITGWIVYMLTRQVLSLKGLKTRPWLIENKNYFSLLVALIFVAHPMQTQAVTYIIQRITSLAALFYLLSVLMYIKGRVSHIERGLGKSAIRYYAATALTFIMAMLSKQIAATLPLALILTELMFIRDQKGNLQKKFLYIFSGAVALGIFIGLIAVGLPRETEEVTRGTYLMTSLKVMVKYIQMMILPIGQNIDHDIKASESLFGFKELGSLAILLGLIFLAYYMYRRDRLVSFGIAWFFITLSIESTIIPIRDFMFEHRMYLPSFGLILAAAAGISYIPYKFKLGKLKVPATLVILSALVFAAGAAAHARNYVWQTDLALWSDSVEKSPEKARPWMWQGIAYSNLKKYKLAKKSFDKCIELSPTLSMAYYNRGNVNKELNEYQNAISDYSKAIEFKKNYPMAYFNRGVIRAKMNQYKEAIKDYSEALKLNPRNSLAYYNRGNAYRNIRKYPESIEDYDRAEKINPRYALAIYNRGLSRAALNNHQEALKDFDKAIALDSKNYLFFNGKGVSLHALKQFRDAIVCYNNTISLNPKFGQAYFNRAYSKLFGLNDVSGACQDWQTALANGYKSAENMLRQYCQGERREK